MKKNQDITVKKTPKDKLPKQTTGNCADCDVEIPRPYILSVHDFASLESTNDKTKRAFAYSGGAAGFTAALVLLLGTFVSLTEMQATLLTALLTPVINTAAVYLKHKLEL